MTVVRPFDWNVQQASPAGDRVPATYHLAVALVPPVVVTGWVGLSVAISLGFATAGHPYEYLTLATGAILGRLFRAPYPLVTPTEGD